MTLPKTTKYIPTIMELLSDGKIHTRKDIIEYCIKEHKIKNEDFLVLKKDGKTPLVYNRIEWAYTYLYQVELIDRVSQAHYRINSKGIEAFKNGAENIYENYIK